MTIGRREFLRRSAMAAATSAAAWPAGSSPAAERDVAGELPVIPRAKVEWNKAPCRFCGTGCHVMVAVDQGRVVAVAGDRKAEVNRGLLCVKGYHVGMALYGEDRLTKPLLRKDGRLEPIEWDEAIDVIARRILQAPAQFAFYGSGQWTIPEGYAAQKLMKGGLSNNHIDPNARLCMASAVTGFISTYGVDEPPGCYDDLDHCDVLINWGNNPAEMHPVLFSRVIDRRSRGEEITIIDISTRRTRTTESAQHFLPIQPNGDLAVANGIAHLLMKNGAWDREFVEKHCNFRIDGAELTLLGEPTSLEHYRKQLEPYTPEYVEKLSGVPAEQILMLGELFARRDVRITSLWCMGMNQHNRGTSINRLVHAIHLLSGHFGRPGDSPTSLTGQPSACGTAREVGTLAHALPGGRLVAKAEHRQQCEEAWKLPEGRIHSEPGYHTVEMFRRFCTPTEEGGDITTLLVQVTNPGQSLPNLHKLFHSKQGLEDKFLIVSDVYPTATTELADLVLPAAMWVEKNGIYGNSERRTQQWFKMVEPPGEARDDCWMTIAIARRLYELGHPGLKDRDGNFLFSITNDSGEEVPVWEWEHYYDVNVDRVLYEEYRPLTWLKHKNVAPYDELARHRGLRWPVVQDESGTWVETPFRFVEGDPFVEPGERVDFYESVTGDGRAQIWFCPWSPPAEVVDDEYPFWLSTGRVLEHWHTATMTMRIGPLRRAMPQAYVEMHPEDAQRLRIDNGEVVRVRTRRGDLELPVWLDGRGRVLPGMLFVPFFDERLLVNELTLDAVDPISKEPDYKKCAARVEKIRTSPRVEAGGE